VIDPRDLTPEEQELLMDAYECGSVSVEPGDGTPDRLVAASILRPTRLGANRYEVTNAGMAWLEGR
jgi:hypothetical protein